MAKLTGLPHRFQAFHVESVHESGRDVSIHPASHDRVAPDALGCIVNPGILRKAENAMLACGICRAGSVASRPGYRGDVDNCSGRLVFEKHVHGTLRDHCWGCEVNGDDTVPHAAIHLACRVELVHDTLWPTVSVHTYKDPLRIAILTALLTT